MCPAEALVRTVCGEGSAMRWRVASGCGSRTLSHSQPPPTPTQEAIKQLKELYDEGLMSKEEVRARPHAGVWLLVGC